LTERGKERQGHQHLLPGLPMSTRVVGLGAWCDYETEDEYRKYLTEPRETAEEGEQTLPGWSPYPSVFMPIAEQVEEAIKDFRRGLHFRVEEFVTLSDGRRLILSTDRGWGQSMSGGRGPDEQWAYETVETIESTVLNVVLPDDAEETGEDHPWEWLAERILRLGVETTPEELRQLPYDVVLSDRLRARLTGNS
jgi:hypothetical protein